MILVAFFYNLQNHKWLFLYNIRKLPSRTEWLNQVPVKNQVLKKGPLLLERSNWENITNYKHGNGGEDVIHEILFYRKADIYLLDHHNRRLQTMQCPYKNCRFTEDISRLGSSSGVVFTLSHGKLGISPPRKYPGQVWVFTDIEPPIINNAFGHRHRHWNNLMNWSMTYRTDSDILKSFALLEEKPPNEVVNEDYSAIFAAKTGFAVWLVSNCGSDVMSSRSEFVQELQKYIPVDIFGKCGSRELDRKNPRTTIAQYKFFFAFENSLCLDYVSEKFYDNFGGNTILVARGGANYDKLFPTDTFINTRQFQNAKTLADFLIALNSSEEGYTQYLVNKNKYRFAFSRWECDLCSKINNKDKYQRIYPSIPEYWHDNVCFEADDIQMASCSESIHLLVYFLLSVIFLYGIIVYRRTIFRYISVHKEICKH